MSPSQSTCFCAGGQTLNVKTLERTAVERALVAAAGDKARAASLLGMSPKTLYTKIDRYGWRERKWTTDEAKGKKT